MGQEIKINVAFIPDTEGFIGRECLKCEEYFKVKPGTGLPIQHCICPCCGHQGPGTEFFTKDQIEYAKSVAIKKAVDPILDGLYRSFKKLGRQRGRSELINY